MVTSTKEMTVYKYKQYPVRITLDDNGEPWFVAKDVCDALGLKHVTAALRSIPADEKGMKKISTLGGDQTLNIISESGRNRLTMRCNKPTAKPFQDWIAKEAMPSIRKTGSYSIEPITSTTMMKEFARGMVAMADKLDEHESRLRELEKDKQIVAVISAPVKEISTRLKINQIVREYAQNNGKDYREYFKTLYYEFKYRYGIDLICRNRNSKEDKTIMDTAERCGCLDDLFTLAVALFVGK